MPDRFFVMGIIMNQVELLAPAGSYESALAAFNAGADAVYAGGEFFSARAYAENFTTKQLLEVMDYAHLHGKKVYLTINTLLKEQELSGQLFSYLQPLYCAGLDAVIVQDLGVLQFIRKYFPKLRIHASTQMTVFGKETAKALEKSGVSRIVVPREFSLEEIRDIRNATALEIESFVHGALCYCYSGQCLLSSFVGGRSGNRGRCAQPCRMEYDYLENNRKINGKNQTYLLSPKDICTLKILPQIIASGVTSLKIEGRMKKTEYVAGVVSIYRKYLDLYAANPSAYQVLEQDIQNLMDLFHRNGFHESYYMQHNGKNMISLQKPQFRVENQELTEFLRTQYIGKKLKIPLDISVTCLAGQPFRLDTEAAGKNISVTGPVPSPAKSTPLNQETLGKHIGKLGGTSFETGRITFDLGDGLFLPVSAINDLRRTLIQKTEEAILSKYRRKTERQDFTAQNTEMECPPEGKTINIHCLVWNVSQFLVVSDAPEVKRIYLEAVQFSTEKIRQCIADAHRKKKEIYLALPYVFRKDDCEKFLNDFGAAIPLLDGVLIRNIEQYFCFRKNQVVFDYVFDYNVYTMNRYAKQYVHSLGAKTTAPLELNYHELKALGVSDSELIIYGYIPVMISANCVRKTFDRCRRDNQMIQLKDKKNNVFSVQCVCGYCYNLMLNSYPLSLFKYADRIRQLFPASLRLIFSTESAGQTEKILKCAQRAFLSGQPVADEAGTTRGHFMRGVQ